MIYNNDYHINKYLESANKSLCANLRCTTDKFWFEYNRAEKRYEFWEKRGPMKNMVFPVDFRGEPLSKLTNWEVRTAVLFVRGARTTAKEENYYKNKEYRKWMPNA